MAIDWDLLDKIIYINLKERSDRRKSIERELSALSVPGDKIVRFEARRHLLGPIGRAQSHRDVLEMAIANGWGNILVLEDDMVFSQGAEAENRLRYFFHVLAAVSWDAALLGANYQKTIALKATDKVLKLVEAYCPCAYVVHGNYQIPLLECFDGAVKRLLQGASDGMCALGEAWLPLMQRDSWLGIYPVAGAPVAGKSNIKNNTATHTASFYKDIEDLV